VEWMRAAIGAQFARIHAGKQRICAWVCGKTAALKCLAEAERRKHRAQGSRRRVERQEQQGSSSVHGEPESHRNSNTEARQMLR
jgi:hypothetical protein